MQANANFTAIWNKSMGFVVMQSAVGGQLDLVLALVVAISATDKPRHRALWSSGFWGASVQDVWCRMGFLGIP